MPDKDDNKIIRELEKRIRLLERKLEQDGLSTRLVEEANDRYQNIYRYVLTELTRQKEELEEARNVLHERTVQLESANRQLKTAKEKAEQSDRFKSEFLANMSHEIRTPMNAVIGYTSLLEQTRLDSVQEEYLKEIKTASDLLLFLVNDILDLSKIEAGKMIFNDRDFNMEHVIRECVSLNRPRAAEKGIYIRINYDESIPAPLKGDPMRLKQVLNNLVSNAVKFTAEGGVTVDAVYKGRSGCKEAVHVSVTDTGPGIRDDEKEILFEPFVQSRMIDYEKSGGTGLGLTICRKILLQRGSDIAVESEYGSGSRFYFDLYLEKGSGHEDAAVEDSPAEIHINKGISILAAEDNSTSLKLFLKHIEKLGLSADTAANGDEAVSKCCKKAYDLVFLDNIMPLKTGAEAAREIRESGKSMNAVIIGITGGVLKEERDELFMAGMNDLMSKPVIPDELREKIAKYFPSDPDTCPRG